MSRLQFLMLVAVEHGATLSEATDWELDWGERHPEEPLYEYRPYATWRRTIGAAVESSAISASQHDDWRPGFPRAADLTEFTAQSADAHPPRTEVAHDDRPPVLGGAVGGRLPCDGQSPAGSEEVMTEGNIHGRTALIPPKGSIGNPLDDVGAVRAETLGREIGGTTTALPP
jgi:hypothetical protein